MASDPSKITPESPPPGGGIGGGTSSGPGGGPGTGPSTGPGTGKGGGAGHGADTPSGAPSSAAPGDGVPPSPATPNGSGTKDALAELRLLLLGPETQRIAQMQEEIASIGAVSAEEVSSVLPQAVRRSAHEGRQIDEAMVPVVEEALGLSAKRDAARLGDLLFPVIGPAIRKAVREALNGMIQAFNQTIDHSVSPRAVLWRFEAWRSGKPFYEVVFLHTMVYRVEQVFLIHRETGLLLQHAAAPHPPVKDADVVSGMLTAIQDFVRDSFKTKEGDTLDRMNVGDLTVVIEQGPAATVAGVVRGHAPEDLRYVFHEALAEIHREQADDLRMFNGDTSVFRPTRPHLEGCLQFQVHPKAKEARAHKSFFTPARLFGAILAVTLVAGSFFYLRAVWRWQSYLDRLRAEPGIVVTQASQGWLTSRVDGLRDPLARDPRAFLADSRLDPAEIESTWKPYHAMEPQFMLLRAQALLKPPETVSMQIGADGTLEAIGSASRGWIADARRLAVAVPGITRFKDDRLTDTDLERLQHLREQVQVHNVLFPAGDSLPTAASRQTIAALVADITQLARAAVRIGYTVDIEVHGHTDSSGAELMNLELSQERAAVVRDVLRASVPANVRLTTRGVSSSSPLRPEVTEADRAWNRRVAVTVTLRNRETGQAADADPGQAAAGSNASASR